jgi:ABC-type antimicrobial peptide transport system permease subunit
MKPLNKIKTSIENLENRLEDKLQQELDLVNNQLLETKKDIQTINQALYNYDTTTNYILFIIVMLVVAIILVSTFLIL